MSDPVNANTRQIYEWNGAAGDSWSANHLAFERMLTPFSDALLEAANIRRGERVLEIGCGAGGLAISMAKRGARVTAVDVSETLFNLARFREIEAGVSVDFRLGDASHAAFAPDYDLLTSHLGVMFFDDPVAAFANMCTALKPDGRLAMLTWRGMAENDLPKLAEAALAPDLAAPIRPAGAPGPFSFGDRDRVFDILTQAGFRDIAVTPFDAAMVFGEGEDGGSALDDAMGRAFHIGPLSRWLEGQSELIVSGVCQRLRKLLSYHVTPRGVELKGAAWIITARI